MPAFRAAEVVHGESKYTQSLAGVRVQLGRGLGEFIIPCGISVVTRMRHIPEAVDAPELHRILGRADLLTLPHIYTVRAKQDGAMITLGLPGYHETQIISTFFRTHNQSITVKPSSDSDSIRLNDQEMQSGFSLPVLPHQQVVFEATMMLM